MKINLTESNIREGEEMAYDLFQRVVAGGESAWVQKRQVLGHRGLGTVMVRKVYAVARHVEGAKISKSLARRGVDTVSLMSIRTALRRVGDGLVKVATTRAPKGEKPDGALSGARAELGRTSSAGGSLARFTYRSLAASRA